MKEEFHFLSKDEVTRLRAVRYMPEEGQARAVLQITHGMQEFIDRYDEFAEFLNSNNIAVYGMDLLGHGGSVKSKSYWGFMAEPHPSDTIISDMYTLHGIIKEDLPGVPRFMLGHSMGSFLLRKYLMKYGKEVSGAIIMGTGFVPKRTSNMGLRIVKLLARFKGWKSPSPLVDKMMFSGPYKKFNMDGSRPEDSWLTKDIEIVKNYYSDPRCTFKFTLNAYKGLIETVLKTCSQENINKTHSHLPILIVSGEEDPVGNFGQGVKKVYNMYKDAGIEDLSCVLYKNDRHEILNELDRSQIYRDLLKWIINRIQ